MERLERLRRQLAPESPAGPSVAPEPALFNNGRKTALVSIAEEYDYIVVGAGSAGCVAAARLSEDKNVTVLILEAGLEEDVGDVRTPIKTLDLHLSERDWKLRTEPNPQQNNRVSLWPRGKVLGGCSAINAMIYVRGNANDYNTWALLGCDGWSYKDVLPYFLKSERSQVKDGEPGFHGTSGPMGTCVAVPGCVHRNLFIEAGGQAGYPINKDYNGSSQYGFGPSQYTIEGGIRASTARAFLRPAMERPNLTVATEVHVTKVVVQGTTAIGVAYKRGSHLTDKLRTAPTQIVLARKEIILCGGAVHSPALLLHSGIGPRDHLNYLSIPVVVDSPGVGKNLRDHLLIAHNFKAEDGLATSDPPSLINLLPSIGEYMLFKTGKLASPGLEAMAFLKTGLSPDIDVPDLQIHHFNIVLAHIDRYIASSEIDGKKLFGDALNKPINGVTMAATLLHPRSIGTITLRNADPLTPPVINANYFADAHDLRVLVEGLKINRKLAQQPVYKGHLGPEIIDETIPHKPASDEYLAEYARRYAVTVYHPVGTCKMGPSSDPTAVVDRTVDNDRRDLGPLCTAGWSLTQRGHAGPRYETRAVWTAQLRVHGVARLRVADASIMPTLISGNTNAPAIMIGERVADFIRHDNAAAAAAATKRQ